VYYYVRITNTNNNASGAKTAAVTSDLARVAIGDNAAAPTISVQPVGKAYMGGHQPAAVTPLTVTASVGAGTLSYQWYSNTSNSTTGATLITGATSASYTPPVTAAGDVYYFVRVTNTNNAVLGTPTAVTTSTLAMVRMRDWTRVANSTLGNAQVRTIAYGDGRFIAAGADGKMAWSTDGATWTAVANSTFGTSTINSVAYGNNLFVAVGASGKMASSSNGTTWTTRTSTFGTSLIRTIAYGNNLFVAVGDSGKMAYSSNGTTWTARTGAQSTFGSSNIAGIAYGDGRWLAGGVDTKMAYSANGTTWTARTGDYPFDDPNNYGVSGFVYGGGRWNARSIALPRMAYSTDNGVTWTGVPRNFMTGYNIDAFIYGNDRLVATGSFSGVGYSDDNGITWTQTSSSSSLFRALDIAYGNGRFVVVGNAGAIAWIQWP